MDTPDEVETPASPTVIFKNGAGHGSFKDTLDLHAAAASPAFGDQNFGGDPETGVNASAYSKDAVCLTLEFLPTSTARFLVSSLRLALLGAVALLIAHLWWKVATDPEYLLYNNTILILNTATGAVVLVLLLVVSVYFLCGVVDAWRKKQKWNRRRKRYFTLGAWNLIFDFLVAIFFLAPNVHSLAEPCSWVLVQVQVFSSLRWDFFTALIVLQNLQAITLVPMDAVRWYKGPCLIGLDLPSKYYVITFFVLFTPSFIIQFFRMATQTLWFDTDYICEGAADPDTCSQSTETFQQACEDRQYKCVYNTNTEILSIIATLLNILIFVLYFVIILFARRALRRLPYKEYRISHIELGFQLQTRFIAGLVYILGLILLNFVRPSTCNSIFITTMGYAPMQLIFAVVVAFQVVLCTPGTVNLNRIKLHAWLQDHAWTESEIEAKLAARPFQGEPCFCFETALKLFYFCELTYDIDEVPESPYTIDVALGLYKLTEYRVLWHRKQDAKALVAWDVDQRTIVFAFRGTASMANVLADIKVWRQAHPPKRGNYYLGTLPMVHRGFLETWEESGLKAEVLTLLDDIMESSPATSEAPWRVLTTGHSLGGALAHLASHDIATSPNGNRIQLTCLTYGAPRPGNHAFARSFRAAVPDAWDVYHSDDAVANSGKFFFMYKRAAQKVIFTSLGGVGAFLVRPTYAEETLQRGMKSVQAHLLGNYAEHLGAIMKAEIGEESAKNVSGHQKASEEHNSASSNSGGAADAHADASPSLRSLRALFACEYVQAVITSTGAMRHSSLLRLAGAGSSAVERARLNEGLTMAPATGEKQGCGCDGWGEWFKRSVAGLQEHNLLGYRKKDLALHVAD